MWPFDRQEKRCARQEKECAFLSAVSREHERLTQETDGALRYEGLKNLAEKISEGIVLPRPGINYAYGYLAAMALFGTGLGVGATVGIVAPYVALPLTLGLGAAWHVPDEVYDLIHHTQIKEAQELTKKCAPYRQKINEELAFLLEDGFSQVASSPHFERLSKTFPELERKLESSVERLFKESGLAEQFKKRVRTELKSPKSPVAPSISPLLKLAVKKQKSGPDPKPSA